MLTDTKIYSGNKLQNINKKAFQTILSLSLSDMTKLHQIFGGWDAAHTLYVWYLFYCDVVKN
jgi:hypothetical protein